MSRAMTMAPCSSTVVVHPASRVHLPTSTSLDSRGAGSEPNHAADHLPDVSAEHQFSFIKDSAPMTRIAATLKTLRPSSVDPLVMVMEDGMSFLSFALGLLYLHRGNGAAFLAKCVSRHLQPADLSDFDFRHAQDAEPQQAEGADANGEVQKPVRLFYFAM